MRLKLVEKRGDDYVARAVDGAHAGMIVFVGENTPIFEDDDGVFAVADDTIQMAKSGRCARVVPQRPAGDPWVVRLESAGSSVASACPVMRVADGTHAGMVVFVKGAHNTYDEPAWTTRTSLVVGPNGRHATIDTRFGGVFEPIVPTVPRPRTEEFAPEKLVEKRGGRWRAITAAAAKELGSLVELAVCRGGQHVRLQPRWRDNLLAWLDASGRDVACFVYEKLAIRSAKPIVELPDLRQSLGPPRELPAVADPVGAG